MHGTYVFLLSRKDFPNAVTDEELIAAVKDHFESRYANHHCDENNWYQEEVLITDTGEVLNLAEAGDYRGRDGFAGSFAGDTTPDKMFERAVTWAMSCAALEMELYDASRYQFFSQDAGGKKIGSADFATLHRDILKLIPEKIAYLYIEAIGKPSCGWHMGDYGMEVYARQNIVRAFEHFINSTVVPFSTTVDSPDKYRCYDLREDTSVEEKNDQLMVLFVDIHT